MRQRFADSDDNVRLKNGVTFSWKRTATSALPAMTTLKKYHNDLFSHMVNVSILTMGQARAFGIDGPLLREFALSALMHDNGKVRTPIEILNKAGKLTDAEFAIMQRHTIDGAEILRQTPEMPMLAPVVAFEHHCESTGAAMRVSFVAMFVASAVCVTYAKDPDRRLAGSEGVCRGDR